ncbi:hypothetical protein [Rickettsia endosymbiont of Orchestes rusci]|uniref:hypothetical protein n=1 Tax=Rickettsia endosymbiont of Orchestes rusci TaxID=3066250 RepID=UPI00313D8F72
MSFPRRRESRKIMVILNLFQDLLLRDAANLFSMTRMDSRFHGNDTSNTFTVPRKNDIKF